MDPHVLQGFQFLGIAWREKHQLQSARTHEWGQGPPKGPLMGSKAAPPCVGFFFFFFCEVECIISGPLVV